MACDLIVYVDNDNLVEIPRLENQADGEAIEDASISILITDSSGTLVPGVTWPIYAAHTGGGRYIGVLDSALQVADTGRYQAVITATSPTVGVAKWRRPVQSKVRR